VQDLTNGPSRELVRYSFDTLDEGEPSVQTPSG
jgi:hypothetical protein